MIDFLSLFVGLILGVQNVEVTVSGPVERVEVRLNDTVLAEIEGGPWVVQGDFGRELHPALLEAVAFGRDGRELARARRWINFPGQRAEAEIVPIRDPDGRVSAARLTWSSPEFEKPNRIDVELDGRRLRVRKPFRVDLTDVPEQPVHILSAELEFSPEVVIRRELVFGPDFEGDFDSGLTAVTVVLDDLEELPSSDDMQGWFLVDGEPVPVAAGEKPDARVVVVRDPTAVRRLAEMLPELERRRKNARRDPSKRRHLDVFDDDVALFALSPEPVQPDNRSTTAVLFPFSSKPTPGSKGLVAATIGKSAASLMGGPLMLSDAVAMGAVRAAEGNGRRAVILLLGEKREDGSRFPPGIARRYLEDLRVPLFVWDLTAVSLEQPPGWGDSRPVQNLDDLVRQVRRVRYRLDEQRIVWVRGRYLPQEIELSNKAKGISLAR